MQIRLEFATLFSSSLGFSDIELDVREGATLGEVIEQYLEENPANRAKLEKWKLFLKGKLRAIYMIDGSAVKPERVLKDKDRVKVLQAFIGG
ncbi:MAG: MoaD/ThiS family protein [Spirochaetales bacterium]|nr:MoaD/ThiS family protein [Spirochaetales bacterium]